MSNAHIRLNGRLTLDNRDPPFFPCFNEPFRTTCRYLEDLYDAPPTIAQTLRDECFADFVLVGDSSTQAYYENKGGRVASFEGSPGKGKGKGNGSHAGSEGGITNELMHLLKSSEFGQQTNSSEFRVLTPVQVHSTKQSRYGSKAIFTQSSWYPGRVMTFTVEATGGGVESGDDLSRLQGDLRQAEAELNAISDKARGLADRMKQAKRKALEAKKDINECVANEKRWTTVENSIAKGTSKLERQREQMDRAIANQTQTRADYLVKRMGAVSSAIGLLRQHLGGPAPAHRAATSQLGVCSLAAHYAHARYKNRNNAFELLTGEEVKIKKRIQDLKKSLNEDVKVNDCKLLTFLLLAI